ncbi:MAG TPA: T9SS type A sorting domain-containing protein, partial [Bacteroidia bacterium]|nr:T9SS type A sorting domain-containing protein [Bacteroidia bacterium]
YIRSMGVYANELYVGGTFDTVDGVSALNLARFNGSSWSSAGDIGVAGAGDGVSAITEYNGELYCGGHFTVAGGIATGGIARGNGSSWQALGSSGGTDGVVLALHVFNQSLYVGGGFNNAGGISVGNIAKWAPPCTPPAATITVQGPPVLCPPGDSILMTANTGAGLTYQWKKGGNSISGASLSGYYATTLGIYSVVVINASGCSATSSAVGISSNTIFANISPAGPTIFCSGGSVVLNAYVGTSYTYQWNKNGINIPGATLSSYTAITAGSYTVDETGGACTKTSLPETIVVNALPSAIITPAGFTTFCSGGSVLLNVATGTNKTYQWKKGGTNISGATLSSYTATVGGTYKVTVTNSVTGCSKTTATGTVITVNPLPSATITPQGPTTFCAGGSVVLQANTGAGLTYKWKKGSNFISGATLSNYTATIGGNYRVQVTNSNGCSKVSALVAVSVPCKEGVPTGIRMDENNFDVKVFPNPSSDGFVFEISNAVNEKIFINIYDIVGKLVLSEQVYNSTFTIRNPQLVPGIYSAEIIWGVNKKVMKLLKTQ